MKHIKNDWTASLKTSSLTRVMYLSLEGPHPDVFDATHEASWVQPQPARSIVLEDLAAELHEIEDSDEAGVPLAIPSDN